MLACPNMLLIGAAGRNVGKTELACELIRQFAPQRPVFGIKVTCVHERNSACPRGGVGCGVCSSLNQPFCITDEEDSLGPKDTSRMLRAGAPRVLWLRVLRDHLEAGLTAVLDAIPPDTLVVCESNSARLAVEPGVFLIVRQSGCAEVKPSCATVLPLADALLDFHGIDRGWSLPVNRIRVAGSRFVLEPEATAIILAGGESTRMGSDKSLLDLKGCPMIAKVAEQVSFFPEILISANDATKYGFLPYPVVADKSPGMGPLMGLACSLERASHDLCFVTGCDTPQIDPGFIVTLLSRSQDYDAVVPRLPSGQIEPLLAVYRKSVAPRARQLLATGQRRVLALLDDVRTCYIPFEPPRWYRNLNTPQDYQGWLTQKPSSGSAR